MNHLIEQQKGLLEETISLRTEILNAIDNSHLDFGLGGKSLTLQDLLLEQASIQTSYINTFKTFKQDWTIKATSSELITVDALKHLFADLDRQLFTTLERLSEEAIAKLIARGGWDLSVEGTLIAYHEAVLIFTAKASIYLRAIGQELTGKLEQWIG